jgi:hypothetical protein
MSGHGLWFVGQKVDEGARGIASLGGFGTADRADAVVKHEAIADSQPPWSGPQEWMMLEHGKPKLGVRTA